MNQRLRHVALVVRDYDEAIRFFCDKLRFRLIEDTRQPEEGKRWVLLSPPGSGTASILLARASSVEQQACVGRQAGGRVFLFLETDDFWRDYDAMRRAGVTFVREPRDEVYGRVAVFADLYGNLWDLVQPSASGSAHPPR